MQDVCAWSQIIHKLKQVVGSFSPYNVRNLLLLKPITRFAEVDTTE